MVRKSAISATLILLFSFMVCLEQQSRASELDYVSYSIPANAIKKGPFSTRGRRNQFYEYYEKNTRKLIAREYFVKDVRINLVLLKDGRKHGLQREWHKNGNPKKEEPYKEGLMHGEFRHWNEYGELIGRYNMDRGNGEIILFHRNGRIKLKRSYKSNLPDGPDFEFHENGQAWSLNWQEKGKYRGKSISFWPNGGLKSIGYFDKKGNLCGPLAYFDKNGALKGEVEYFLNNNKTSKKNYIVNLENNPSLPALIENKYINTNEFLEQEITNIVSDYLVLKPIKIPIE